MERSSIPASVRPAIRYALIAMALTLPLGGCVAAAVGGGAAAASGAVQERGIKGTMNDTGIRAEITDLWLKKKASYLSDLNLQVHEGRVLVTGAVADPDERAEAIQLAWKAEGVKEVINEVEVTDKGGIGAYARDTVILTEFNARLLAAEKIDSLNYSAEAVYGTLYLLGVAHTPQELDRVVAIARNIRNVRKVVSHVVMQDDPRRKQQAQPAS